MRKEIVENAQGEADDTHCQKDHSPALYAKRVVPTCIVIIDNGVQNNVIMLAL